MKEMEIRIKDCYWSFEKINDAICDCDDAPKPGSAPAFRVLAAKKNSVKSLRNVVQTSIERENDFNRRFGHPNCYIYVQKLLGLRYFWLHGLKIFGTSAVFPFPSQTSNVFADLSGGL